MNLRLFMPYPEQKARFENICFKVILFYAGNLKNYVRNLGTMIGANCVTHAFAAEY